MSRHGIDCEKAPHCRTGHAYLHAANDDAPYDVDGCEYCGRCHGWMGAAPKSAPRMGDEVELGERDADR